jgi:hypothetical protein
MVAHAHTLPPPRTTEPSGRPHSAAPTSTKHRTATAATREAAAAAKTEPGLRVTTAEDTWGWGRANTQDKARALC